MQPLDNFFKAKRIAIIGASTNPAKIGHVVVQNFLHSSFEGEVFPINPHADEVLGQKAYPSVLKVPGKIDLAIIITPAKTVAAILEECGRKKIPAATIISSGFKEIGTEGAKLEEKIKKIAAKHNMRVIGPNCLGVYDTASGIDMLFLPAYRQGRPPKGKIAFLSQSGAFGSALLDWSAQQGFGISKFVSYGNAMDVDEVTLLEYLRKDPETSVISMYLEGSKRPRELMEVAKTVVPKKPILCLKVGRSKRGTEAAQSHTGSLAGSDKVYTAAFKQSGIIRVDTVDEMFDYSRALAFQPLPKGKRTAIITDGGGFGVMATDFAEEYGLEMPELSKKTVATLKKVLPTYASTKNPVDLTGSATGDMYEAATRACLEDPNIDAVLVILLFQPPFIESDVVHGMIEINEQAKKPMIICSTGGEFTQVHRGILEKSGIPTFPTPERAVRALRVLYDYAEIRKKFGK